MDAIDLIVLPSRPFCKVSRIPRDLESVTTRGEEVPPRQLGVARGALDRVWERFESLYRTGLYPALQVCIRYQGRVLLHRAIGHASGNAPGDPPEAEKVPVDLDTPFTIFSASKAITAMVIHKLDERGLLHIDDRVCEYIPEFGVHGKQWITIRHVIGHRAGIPNLPAEAMELDLLRDPEQICQMLCEMEPVSRPGRRLAYHAISGGFVLGEIVRRVTGQDIRTVLKKEILEPLGLRWMNYGVAPRDVPCVAKNAFTGFPVLPPLSTVLKRALGADVPRICELSNDPRFLTGVIPAGNIVTTADELSAVFQCLLNEGQLDGVRVFDPRTIQRATQEQSYWEIDFTLGAPIRHGLGFMLGGWGVSLFGPDNPRAFGHLGFTNILAWADPQRELAIAILTSGKPVFSLDVLRLYQALIQISQTFHKLHD